MALDTLLKGDADALKAAAAGADLGNPSSSMDAWKAEAAADDAKQDADADAAMNATDGAADALDIKEKGEADDEQTKDDGDAQAIHDKLVGDAQAAHDAAIADATNITGAVAKSAYTTSLPAAYPAFDYSGVPTPALLDAAYAEIYAVDDVSQPLSAGQDDGASPLPAKEDLGEGGQSWSLGATTDPFSGLGSWTTPTSPTLLSDNGIYDPANPYAGFTGWPGAPWLNVAGPGGSGSPTTPPPQTGGGQQPPQAPPVPPTDPKAAELAVNEEERNRARPVEGDWLKQQQAAERGMTLEEFEIENDKGWLENKRSMQNNATAIEAQKDLDNNGLFGFARGAAEFASDPLKKLVGIPTPAPANPLGTIAGTTLNTMDSVDRAAKNWRQNRTAGNGVVTSAAVVTGTAVGDATGVTNLSNAFSRHEAVNAEREQTIAERVISGVTGFATLVGTAFGIKAAGGSLAGKLKAKVPGPNAVSPAVVEAELAESTVAEQAVPPDVRTLTPVADPARPIYAKGHPGAVVDDHILSRAIARRQGQPSAALDPSNIEPKPYEMNARKGGHEAAYPKDRDDLIKGGLTPGQADSVLEETLDWIMNDALPRLMDPRILDQIPSPGSRG